MAAAEEISKSFPGTRALDRVDLRVDAGQVHALLGANGSGKSTLVKILTGVYAPDAGSIVVGDQRLSAISSPNQADALGIAVVHQESPLIDTLTVSECTALFRGYPTARGRIRWRRLHRETSELLERFGVKVDPRTLAGRLSPAERALVALAIALDRVAAGLSLLVLDEVTASLPEEQAHRYLERVRQLAGDDVPVLMVTHRLAELHGLATRVTVLRSGRVVHHGRAGEVDDETLVRHMVGAGLAAAPSAEEAHADVISLWRRRRPATTGAVLEVRNLAGDLVRDVSFSVSAGEIVGVGGLVEGGVGELPHLLSGARARTGGSIAIGGESVAPAVTPRRMLDLGLALLPADRLRSGGVPSLSVTENIVLPDVGKYWHRAARERDAVNRVITRLDVRPRSSSVLFGRLSGGNQQKVLLGKWLLRGPSVLVLDDPTSGVDPGARATLFSILREAAASGLAVLLFSTELEQLVALCSRVLVLRDGAVAAELAGDGLTRETVTKWCYA